jgi:hypothetical protein
MSDYHLFWGDLHSHCSISYGHGTVEQALARAKQQLDFCSITGHAFWPDMPTDRATYGEIIDYHNAGFETLANNWEELVRLQCAGTTDGEFIAFPGYEWHSLKYGDHNVYAAGPQLPLRDGANLPELREAVRQTSGIAIPHHIGYPKGYRGINWEEYSPEVSPFVEVFSLHGCSVSDDAAYPMLHDMGPRDFGSTAEAGWEMGHQFGIVGGTDHHAAYPGSHGDGRMGVFAKELTRESLWEAFLARRVYAATGDRIDARLFVDDASIGEVCTAKRRRTVRAVVRGIDALEKVEIFKNGRLIKRLFPQQVDPPVNRSRFRLRITWGWGRNTFPAKWDCRLSLSDGIIHDVETCFSGQAIVAPKGTAGVEELSDYEDLPHELIEQSERSCVWRSVTQGNKSMRHETTQALSLDLEARLSDTITIEANGRLFRYELGDLLHRSRAHFLRGWLTEAIRIGPMVMESECTLQTEFTDRGANPTDRYRLQVAQKNGQWAWLTPIWVTTGPKDEKPPRRKRRDRDRPGDGSPVGDGGTPQQPDLTAAKRARKLKQKIKSE